LVFGVCIDRSRPSVSVQHVHFTVQIAFEPEISLSPEFISLRYVMSLASRLPLLVTQHRPVGFAADHSIKMCKLDSLRPVLLNSESKGTCYDRPT